MQASQRFFASSRPKGWGLVVAFLAGLLAVSTVGAGAASSAGSRRRRDPLPQLQPLTYEKPPAGSPWEALNHPPPFFPSAMLLLTDGSVMVQEDSSNQWWRLRPDA